MYMTSFPAVSNVVDDIHKVAEEEEVEEAHLVDNSFILV
jgi:hypothetical protein